jgi:hypothetical protein
METDDGNGKDEAAVCKPIPKCSDVMQCLDAHRCFLSVISGMPESIVRSLWELENFTSNLIKTQVQQMTLGMFFKKE